MHNARIVRPRRGQPGRGTAPSSLPGPHDVLRTQLPNGVTVLARENWSAPSVVVEGYLLVGNLDEPQDMPGLASFVTAMLSRGTRTRAFAEINEAVESVGASIGFSPDRHITNFSTKSLAEDLGLVLDIVAEELRAPAFPAEYVDRVRGLRMTALAERENDTRQMAGRAFRELMYGQHPLGRDMLGTRESLRAITRARLVEFYERFFAPQDMVVSVVGALRADEAVQRIADAFGDWTYRRPARAELPPLTHPTGVRSRHVAMPDKSQSDLVLGWPAMRRHSPDFDPARMANTVLGVFGMMGRLGVNVRERQGMAYYAYSRLSADREPGTWTAIAGVNPANVARTQAAILEEVRRLRDELVPEAELEDCKRYLTGSLPLQMETNDGVASLLVNLEWHQLGLDYLERYYGIINALTPPQLQAVAQKYLDPESYVQAVAGPATD
ncbi:MAG: Peptidase M16 inactive domain protein [Chloroflexi bacterium ADurb.Bin325]|nr:MAG: Peptidase M16 inactive domain protein [Chloroflexi bacterium ADurb.Bin325]